MLGCLTHQQNRSFFVLMDGLPKKAKIARVHVDREGRITFPKPNEEPPDDEWWESVLSDPRARWRLDDSMLGHHASMFIQIVCEKCHRDELKAIDHLILLFGKRHNMTGAVAAARHRH